MVTHLLGQPFPAIHGAVHRVSLNSNSTSNSREGTTIHSTPTLIVTLFNAHQFTLFSAHFNYDSRYTHSIYHVYLQVINASYHSSNQKQTGGKSRADASWGPTGPAGDRRVQTELDIRCRQLWLRESSQNSSFSHHTHFNFTRRHRL